MSRKAATPLKRTEVLRRCGLAPGTLDTLVAAGAFPAPIDQGRWHPADVDAWLQDVQRRAPDDSTCERRSGPELCAHALREHAAGFAILGASMLMEAISASACAVSARRVQSSRGAASAGFAHPPHRGTNPEREGLHETGHCRRRLAPARAQSRGREKPAHRAAPGAARPMEGRCVNYFEFHIGDYSEATAHLSFVEDAALGRLIRKVYKTEAALPLELKEVQRLVGARTREERQAVATVLQEFFERREDGWHQARCDEEIARYQAKQSKARSSANARWHAGGKKAAPAHSQDDAGSMPAHASEGSSGMRSHASDDANASGAHGKRNALQTPDTINQEPHTPRAGDEVVCVDAQAVKAMRDAGLQDAAVGNPNVIALLHKGVAVEQFASAARIAVGVSKGVPYAIGVLRQQLREAEAIARLPDAATKAWDAGRTSIEAKGVELGLGKWDQAAWPAHGGESFAEYTNRVREALRRQEVAAT